MKQCLKLKYRRYIWLFIGCLFLFPAIALYRSDAFMFKYLDKIEASAVAFAETELNTTAFSNLQIAPKIRGAIFEIIDEFTSIHGDALLKQSDLTHIEMKMSADDVAYFESAIDTAVAAGNYSVLPDYSTKTRKVDLSYNEGNFKAEVGLSGDEIDHWAPGKKKSFKIKFKSDYTPEGLKKIRIKIPDDRGYLDPFFSNKVNSLLDLPIVQNEFLTASINNIFYGLYYMEEKYDEQYLEKNNLSNHLILEFDSKIIKRNRIGSEESAYNPSYLEPLEIDNFPLEQQELITNHISDFFTAIKEGDHETIRQYLDIDKLARFEVWRMVLGHKHDVIGANARFAYNLSTGKFWLLPRHESVIQEAGANFLMTDNLHTFMRTNTDFINKRDILLEKLLLSKNDLLHTYDKLHNTYYDLIMSDNSIAHPKRRRNYSMNRSKEYIENNFTFWEEYLSEKTTRDIASPSDDQMKYTLSFGPLTFYRLQNGTFMLYPGTYTLSETTILPKGYEFVFSAGVHMIMKEGVSLLSYSPLDIQGNQYAKVTISKHPSAEKFGVFAVQGFGTEGCKTTISNLDISGGSEDFIEGAFYSGALDIYYCDAEVSNSSVHNNIADDGMNIKNAAVQLSNNQFKNNAFDQVDLDYVTGTVEENIFNGDGGEVNGDGLDMSGSSLVVTNNSFSSFVDKGISIGEQTTSYIVSNIIEGNNIGVAVKDLSEVYFQSNTFSENETDVSLYQKKTAFGGGQGYISDNEAQLISIETDKRSSMNILEEDALNEAVGILSL